MANRYANLVGSNKIKDEYTKINTGFDKVQQEMDEKPDNSFAKINDVEAEGEDAVTIEAGTGITITTTPEEKKIRITATGEATPGPHGSEHNHDGSDPIPDLVQLRVDLNTHLDENAPHPDAEILQASEEIRVTSTVDATSPVNAPLKSAGGLAVAKSAYIGDSVRYSTSDALISSLSKAVRPGEVLEQGKKHVFHVKINPVNIVFLDIIAVYRQNLSTHHHSIHEEMAFYFNGAVVQRLQRGRIADLASSTDIVKIEISDVTFVDATTVKLEIANIGGMDLSNSSYVAINGFGGVYDFVYVGKEDL